MSKIDKINEKTSLYLRKVSDLANGFPPSVRNVLKTSYMAQCASIESLTTIAKYEDYLTITCPACHIDISETAKFNLIPKKCSKFAKKLRKRINNGSELTNYQNSYSKHMPIMSHNTQIAINITCNVCQKSMKKVVSKWKSKKSLKRKAVEEPNAIELSQVQPKKKKRKKKIDQFYGLSTEAVKSVRESNLSESQDKKINKKLWKQPEMEKQRLLIVNNNKKKKKKFKNKAKEFLKNKTKMSQILGISLAKNSVKSNYLNTFFGSF